MNIGRSVVTEHGIQNVDDVVLTTREDKKNLYIFGDERFYVNSIHNYSHEETNYLFRNNFYKLMNPRVDIPGESKMVIINFWKMRYEKEDMFKFLIELHKILHK